MLSMLQGIPTGLCENNKSLEIDEACFSVVNENKYPVTLFSHPSECYVCDGLPWANLSANSNTSLIASTKFPLHVYYVAIHDVCHTTFTLKQYGHYGWNLTDESCSNIYTLYDPPNPYLPLLAAFMIFAFIAVIYGASTFIKRIVKVFFKREPSYIQDDLGRLQESEPPPQPPVKISKLSTRIKSLDAFRGIAVLLMIFVNNGGGKYVFLNHSVWNGLTVADIVMPWFAWAMGLAIVISMRTQLRTSVSRQRIISRCLRRSLILILLGLIINSKEQQHNMSLQNLRFPGILQLLGVSYFICTAIETVFMKAERSFQDSLLQFGRFMFLQDILDSWAQWLIIITITTIHTLIIFLLPVPNCPVGYLGPGGYHYHGKYANCTAGAAGYIDRVVFGNHTYMKENSIYGPVLPHDPEGIMNTLSAVLIVYMGVQAGRILVLYHKGSSKILRWLSWSAVTGIIAGALCNFSKEDGVIPVNKNMMSLSFVLATSSLAFFTYAILYFLIDHRHFWNGAPFTYAGINPILLYVGHYFTMHTFPWAWDTNGISTHASILAMNLWTTTLWTIIAYLFYRKNIILTV